MNQDNVKKLVEAAKEVVKQWDLQSGNDVIVLPIQELDNAIDAIEHDGKVLCGSGWVAKDLKKFWYVGDDGGITVYSVVPLYSMCGSAKDCYTSWPKAVAESERRQGIVKPVNKDGNPPKVGEAVYLEVQDVKDTGKWVVYDPNDTGRCFRGFEIAWSAIPSSVTPFSSEQEAREETGYKFDRYKIIPLSEARRIEAERKAGK